MDEVLEKTDPRLTICIFANCRNGGAYDRYGTKIELFKDVRTIFTELKEMGIPLAAASR